MAQSAARWLFRSHGCLISTSVPNFVSITRNGCGFDLRWANVDSASATGALSLFGRASEPSAARGAFIGSFSATSAPASREAAAENDASGAAISSYASSSGRNLPGWLRNLFPGLRQEAGRKTEAPATSSQTVAGSSANKDADKDEKDLELLKELRSVSMDGYVEYCKKMRSGSTTPRPRLSPLRFTRAGSYGFVDMARVSYLRMQQHERIGSLITKEEGELILAKREEVLHDRALMVAIADRTGMYIDLEVKDCIEQFLELRQRAGRIHRFVTEFDHGLPKTKEEQDYAIEFIKKREAEEKLQAALTRRDAVGCPMRLKLPWAGANVPCELTGRPYWECCGRANAGAPPQEAQERLQLSPHLRQSKRNEPLVDLEHLRKLHMKFKGGIRGRFRKAKIAHSKHFVRRGAGHTTAHTWKPIE